MVTKLEQAAPEAMKEIIRNCLKQSVVSYRRRHISIRSLLRRCRLQQLTKTTSQDPDQWKGYMLKPNLRCNIMRLIIVVATRILNTYCSRFMKSPSMNVHIVFESTINCFVCLYALSELFPRQTQDRVLFPRELFQRDILLQRVIPKTEYSDLKYSDTFKQIPK